jgi:acetylornithine deacetylase/succinyl-diaminopimelate desuccinylase-like protein
MLCRTFRVRYSPASRVTVIMDRESKRSKVLHSLTSEEEHLAVEDLKDIIRFETVSNCAAGNGSYDKCAEWIVSKLKEIGLRSISL